VGRTLLYRAVIVKVVPWFFGNRMVPGILQGGVSGMVRKLMRVESLVDDEIWVEAGA